MMTSPIDSPFLNTEVHFLDSDAVGAQFKVLIGKSGMKEGVPPVVLFLTDADLAFGGTMNTLWGLQFAGWLPPMLVVGIGYPINDESESFPLRSRDLTPSVDDYVAQQSGWPSGGADRFHRFITEELKPWLGTNFDVDPDDNVYFGDSYGGLFGAHVLFSEPATFKRYGLGSSSFWYNHGAIFESEARYAQSNRDLTAKVFCSVGAYEGPEGDQLLLAWLPQDKRAEAEEAAARELADYGETDMVADQHRFVTALRSRNYPSLLIDSEILPGEFHMTAAPLNFSRAMRYLFDAPR
jgi:predicted alpha/beta superfamily hydrolase